MKGCKPVTKSKVMCDQELNKAGRREVRGLTFDAHGAGSDKGLTLSIDGRSVALISLGCKWSQGNS